MRNVNRLIFVMGAVMTASLAVHCGGDDAAAPGGTAGTSTGGSGGAAGSAAGAAGSLTGSGGAAGGAAGSTAGGGGTAGATGGAAGNAGAPANDSGIKDAATSEGGEAGACPASPPAEDTVCSVKQNCKYTATECACAKSKTVDGGRAWGCVDLGSDAGADAEACPATIADGDACTTKGQRCPSGDAGQNCVCAKSVWNCP